MYKNSVMHVQLLFVTINIIFFAVLLAVAVVVVVILLYS